MLKQLVCKSIIHFPMNGFEKLKQESLQEGFNFLRRLEEDWISGKNQFSAKGEGLYAVYLNTALIAIGGINIDPYTNNGQEGRLRRFYILKSFRRKGVGKALLSYILSAHQSYFQAINLYTDNPIAYSFYLSYGFLPSASHPKVSHTILLV